MVVGELTAKITVVEIGARIKKRLLVIGFLNQRQKLDGYKLMIAQYSSREPELEDGRDFMIWQYTGKGHIDGINGYVDKSRFMGRHGLREIRFKHH